MRFDHENLYRCFDDQAERTPHAVAFIDGHNHATYQCVRVAARQLSRHLSWIFSYTRFFTGDYVQSAKGHDVDYFGTWATFTF